MKNAYLVNKNNLEFRRATKNDNIDEIARLLYYTDPYIYPFWFDNNIEDCVEFFKEKIFEDGFIFNYENLYVAYDTVADDIVGVVCAIDKSTNLKYNYESLKNVNNRYRITIEKYIMPILEEVEEFDKESIYVPNVCVDPEVRGRKIGTLLFGHFISQMEQAGFEKFYLDCLLHNIHAKNLYHHLGFKEMKLMNGFTGGDDTVDVVCFLRKHGDYLPAEFQSYYNAFYDKLN